MRPFTYASPHSVEEAVMLLAPAAGANGTAPRALAGGTDLLPLMKADLLAPEQLIDIKRLADLDDRIEDGPDGLTIGALASLAEIEDDPLVRAVLPALAEAAASAATPHLRNMATIGGNLLQRPRCWYFRDPHLDCWLKGGEDCPARDGENQLHALFDVSPCVAVHPSDPATALVALDARVQLRGPRGQREMPIAEFFAPPAADRRRETVIAGDELIVAIRIPPGDGARSTYLKAMERKVWAFALVGVAAVIRMDTGKIADARLVLGGVANVPWRSTTAEQLLVGAEPTEELIARAADAALAEAQPLSHNAYKTPLAQALIRRALFALIPPSPSAVGDDA
jgi:xanthine dehydrogenase YagS FAD-binding subunit